MSNIPRAMWRLRRVADDLANSGLRGKAKLIRTIITQDLPRRKSIGMKHGTRAKCSPALKKRILNFWRSRRGNIYWTQQRIAEKFNVTNARVSEIVNPKR